MNRWRFGYIFLRNKNKLSKSLKFLLFSLTIKFMKLSPKFKFACLPLFTVHKKWNNPLSVFVKTTFRLAFFVVKRYENLVIYNCCLAKWRFFELMKKPYKKNLFSNKSHINFLSYLLNEESDKISMLNNWNHKFHYFSIE